jgi:LacI family transcriptional regulator
MVKKPISITMVAKELHLAPSTISKVINQTGSVSSETRERVLAYIKEVGYAPATNARMLRSKRAYSIGIVFQEELNIGLEHPFFSSILQHFKNYVEQEGYEVAFIVKKIGQHQLSYYQWCRNKRVDGVYIVVGDYTDPGIRELIDSEIPCVSTDMIVPGLHTIKSDDDQGIRISLEYIKSTLRKQRVAHITGPLTSIAFLQRLRSYDHYKVELGLVREDHYAIVGRSFDFASGYASTIDLLDHVEHLPEVITVASDDLALGVLQALRDRHILVPQQIQVIGFDDVSFAKHTTPALTTIAQDRKRLGEIAAQLLIKLIENPVNKVRESVTLLPVSLVIRDSTQSHK